MIQKQFSFRSITNNGDKAKIIIMLCENHDYPDTVIIHKRVLTKDKNIIAGCLKRKLPLLRRYKQYTYFEEGMALKLETIFHILQGLIHIPNARTIIKSNESNQRI